MPMFAAIAVVPVSTTPATAAAVMNEVLRFIGGSTFQMRSAHNEPISWKPTYGSVLQRQTSREQANGKGSPAQ
jgi:hypothetical protein